MRLHSGLCVISALMGGMSLSLIVSLFVFVCLSLFVCIWLWSYLCVLRLQTLVCDKISDPDKARLMLTQFVTKFDMNATCHKVYFFPNCQKTSYQIFFPNLGFCEDLFFANQCQVVVSQWQKHKQIKSRNFQTVKGDVCNHASISIQILLCLARAV